MLEFPPAPKGGLAGFAEQFLRRALIEGHLAPGERLVARDLAARIGTSPTPVREALLKLVANGVIEASPAQSFQVPRLTAARYLEIAEIRKAVECLAAETATEHIKPAEIDQLEILAAGYRMARESNDARNALRLNHEFRFRIYQNAGMPTLVSLIETLWLMIGPSLNFLFPVRANPSATHNYDTLIAALRRADRSAVGASIRRAIDEGTASVLAHMGEHGSDAVATTLDPAVSFVRARRRSGKGLPETGS